MPRVSGTDETPSAMESQGTHDETPASRPRSGRAPLRLSVVIPAHNEEDSIAATVRTLAATLTADRIPHEILVIDDASSDRTAAVVDEVSMSNPSVRCVRSHLPPGFGHAVRAGLDHYTGDAVAIFMADSSDSPADLVRYHEVLVEGFDCAFGSRFIRGGRTVGYPLPKLLINRVVNFAIRVMFRHGYNDTTNAFKAYRREVIDNIRPLLSNHFNLTVEMPLKALTRGHTFAVVPIIWTNRQQGISKLRLQEMGSRYMFIVLYVFLEHHLSGGDYRRPDLPATGKLRVHPGITAAELPTGSRVSRKPRRRSRAAGRGDGSTPSMRVPG
jgi:dolichol-phosphate mannosyltransferase